MSDSERKGQGKPTWCGEQKNKVNKKKHQRAKCSLQVIGIAVNQEQGIENSKKKTKWSVRVGN